MSTADQILEALATLRSAGRGRAGFFLQPAEATVIADVFDLLMADVEVKDRTITELRAEVAKLKRWIDTGVAP